MSVRFRNSLLLLGAIALAAPGCSNTRTASDPGASESTTGESSADDVGSIPEDLLASEERSEGGEEAPPEASQKEDPFESLQSAESSAGATDENSMNLIEGGSVASAGSGRMSTVKVKAGDTLMKIAFSIYGDIDRWRDLQEWNAGKLKNANRLKPGMSLSYEEPLTPFSAEEHAHSYLIQKGDTLAGIADEVYGRRAKFKKLQKYNANLIKNPHKIFAGFRIFYDITQQEMAEAEARRQERLARGEKGSVSQPSSPTPVEAATPPPPAPMEAAVPDPAPPLPSAIAPPPPAMLGPEPPPVAGLKAPASSNAAEEVPPPAN